MIEQQKKWEKKNNEKWNESDEKKEMGGGDILTSSTGNGEKIAQTLKRNIPEPVIVMNKTVTVKRPGKEVQFYGMNGSLIAWCMARKGIRYSKAKIRYSEYVRLGKQPGRKKARGYLEFTIDYAE